MKDFYATAKIQFYDEIEGNTKEENIALTEVENFVDAVTRIEAFYGNDLEAIIELNLFEGPFITLSNKSLEALVCGDLEKEEK